jgi:two-component system nitrate/nitrite response regulator NarL
MNAHHLDHSTPAISSTDGRSNGTEPDVITALICDTPLLRSGLQRVLSGTPFVIAEENPATAREPALCILAVGQRSSRTPEMARQIKDSHPAARIVVLADHFEIDFFTKARAAGVDGFCLTGSRREVLTTSLELVMLGESMLPGALVGSILDGVASNPEPQPERTSPVQVQPSASRQTNLSVREKEILGSLMNGAPNKIIARKLDVAEATVKVHVKAILRKIGVANRTQAAMWAMSHLPSAEETSLHG